MTILVRVLLVFALAAAILPGQSSDELAVSAVVQKLFDGMAAHNVTAIQSVLLPNALLYSTRNDGPPTSTSSDEFLSRISKSTHKFLERFTHPAKILVQGRTAQVWGEYEFLLDGKRAHCGIDSFSLLKSADGWKIASVVYTAETNGCPGR